MTKSQSNLGQIIIMCEKKVVFFVISLYFCIFLNITEDFSVEICCVKCHMICF